MKKLYLITISILFFKLVIINFTNAEITSKIILKVDEKIITNFDIENEINYLKALNNNLINLKKEKIYKIAKNSLIEEIIKKKELKKYYNFENYNEELDLAVENFLKKINLKNIDELKNYLETYNIEIEYLKKKIEIENTWNDFIFNKYKSQIKIDEDEIKKKLNNIKNNKFAFEYNLSEIIFKKSNELSLEEQSKKIFESILENGFENTANLYSISDSAKLGGNIGWINSAGIEKSLLKELEKIDKNQSTSLIQIGNNFLILKINDIRKKKFEVDISEELKKIRLRETIKQYEQFSNIYFNKIKVNSIIDEF